MFKYCRLSTASTFINPDYDTNFPDPHIIRVDGKYYAYSANDSGANVPTLRSESLVYWTVGEDAMPELAPWTAPGKTWDPRGAPPRGR